MKAISLFSGAGGCSRGFFESGFEIIAAFDNTPSAIETYNKNFGDNLCKKVDLSSCNFEEIRDSLELKRGELDIIIGGPPCQGFTTAGKRSEEDPRNKLISNYVDALDKFLPRWFVMENVEGVLTSSGGKYIIDCLKSIIALGYSVSLEKVYAQEYDIPQRRKRVIVVGNREGKEFTFPKPNVVATGAIFKDGSTNLKMAIGDLEGIENPSIDHSPKWETGIQLERMINLGVGKTMKDLPERLQHDSFKKRANRRVCDGTPSEKRGGAPSGLKRLSYKEPALTITSAATSEFVHPKENRTLTLRECARIQTFPDDFVFCGTDSQKALQIGNAIPPLLAKKIAQQIIKCDKGKKLQVPSGLINFSVTKATAMSPTLKKTYLMLEGMRKKKNEQMRLFI